MTVLPWLDSHDEDAVFPDVSQALREPDGLLAMGGSLGPRRLLRAYRRGIFPWYNEGQPILWWSPDPRAVLFPEQLKVSRSLRKTLRRGEYEVTLDRAFPEVMDGCAGPRHGHPGTWITPEMRQAYCRLHELGWAHSCESWHQGQLVGGLYGVAIGRVFFGESMFSRRTDASKTAFACLARQLRRWGYRLIDCQLHSEHLASLGAEVIPRASYIALLDTLCELDGRPAPWRFDPDFNPLDPVQGS